MSHHDPDAAYALAVLAEMNEFSRRSYEQGYGKKSKSSLSYVEAVSADNWRIINKHEAFVRNQHARGASTLVTANILYERS